jgi:D-glycero-D-manno-heptose 1,7-bisphosphate phosphatase
MNRKIAVFLDRDGTINEEVGYLDRLEKLKIFPNAARAIRALNESGLMAIVISNQAGVARGFFTEEFVISANDLMQATLKKSGAKIDKFYYCPHHPTEGKGKYLQNCECRKPAPGMLLQAARDFGIDLRSSYFIGDRFLDMETARRVGAKGILVKTGYGDQLLQDDGPDKATAENRPDFVAADILEAVLWILQDIKKGKDEHSDR